MALEGYLPLRLDRPRHAPIVPRQGTWGSLKSLQAAAWAPKLGLEGTVASPPKPFVPQPSRPGRGKGAPPAPGVGGGDEAQ